MNTKYKFHDSISMGRQEIIINRKSDVFPDTVYPSCVGFMCPRCGTKNDRLNHGDSAECSGEDCDMFFVVQESRLYCYTNIHVSEWEEEKC